MNNTEIVKNTVVAVVGIIVGFLGGFDIMLQSLIILMVIDYITGIISGVINKKISSHIGFIGILKKMLILLIVCVAVQLDKIMQTDIIRSVTIFFYLANEGISILENTANSGIKYPKKLISVLEQLTNKENES